MNRSTPTVARRLVASTLRRLREQAKLTKAEAAKIVEHDASWLTRVENCESRVHPNDLRVLLPAYGLSSGAAEAVMAMARQARSRSWWQTYSDAMPDWFQLYVGLESDASVIRTYEQQSVPGLLQTEDYARAAMLASPIPPSSADIDRRLQLRMQRQVLLESDDPPQLRVVLDEAVIRRQVGGPKVMCAQRERLLEMMDRPNIDIQVLPFSAGAHAGFDCSFVLLEFPKLPSQYPDADPRVAYVDVLAAALYLENHEEVRQYAAAWDRICSVAATPTESRKAVRIIE